MCKVAGSSNGRIDASGAFHLGSNPSPAALHRNKMVVALSATLEDGILVRVQVP